jgi:hypothetical protein
VSNLSGLLDRLGFAVVQAVRSGEVGIVRSLRLHVGGPDDDLPTPGRLLALGDAIFANPRAREAEAGGARLCVWEVGQIATVSSAPAPRAVVVLTVLGSEGALHFRDQSP